MGGVEGAAISLVQTIGMIGGGGGGGQLSVDATDDGTTVGTVAVSNGLGNNFRGAGTGGGGGGGIANCGGAGGGCIASCGFGTVRGVLKASG